LLAIKLVFALSTATAQVLLALLQHELVPCVDNQKLLQVRICELRKRLAPHGLRIKTEWGSGYRLSPEQRRHAMALVLREAAA
jgi:DNA-binding response OmpR family regulator